MKKTVDPPLFYDILRGLKALCATPLVRVCPILLDPPNPPKNRTSFMYVPLRNIYIYYIFQEDFPCSFIKLYSCIDNDVIRIKRLIFFS